MTRDERSASFMADVYARVSGRVGVCEGPSGGGATYIVPGVAEAQGSAIPLLCLTSDTPVDQQGRGVLTELDQESLFRPVTKWNTRVNSAATMAEADPPGDPHGHRRPTRRDPSVASRPTRWKARRRTHRSTASRSSGRAPAMRTRPDQALVERAAAALAAAERPVIVAGGGVLTSGAWDELTALAETLNIPVATSINGKGSIAETSAVAIGVIGGNGARPYANACLADADLVLYVGTRTDSTTTCHWTLPPIDSAAKRHPDRCRAVRDRQQLPAGRRRSSATPSSTLAATAGGDRSPDAVARPQPAADRRASWRSATATGPTSSGRRRNSARPIKPAQVVRAMRDALDDDAIIVADPGTPTPFLSAQYELRRAGRTTVIPRAHGGLGYAIPGVVGAWYAGAGPARGRHDRRRQLRHVGRRAGDDHPAGSADRDHPVLERHVWLDQGAAAPLPRRPLLRGRFQSRSTTPRSRAGSVSAPPGDRSGRGATGDSGGRSRTAAVLPRRRHRVADHGNAAGRGLDRGRGRRPVPAGGPR